MDKMCPTFGETMVRFHHGRLFPAKISDKIVILSVDPFCGSDKYLTNQIIAFPKALSTSLLATCAKIRDNNVRYNVLLRESWYYVDEYRGITVFFNVLIILARPTGSSSFLRISISLIRTSLEISLTSLADFPVYALSNNQWQLIIKSR